MHACTIRKFYREAYNDLTSPSPSGAESVAPRYSAAEVEQLLLRNVGRASENRLDGPVHVIIYASMATNFTLRDLSSPGKRLPPALPLVLPSHHQWDPVSHREREREKQKSHVSSPLSGNRSPL